MKQKKKIFITLAIAMFVMLLLSIIILGDSDRQYKPEKKNVPLKIKLDD